jgi:hypothetical protein
VAKNSSQVAGFGYFVRSDFGQADMMMSGVVTPGQVEIAPEPAGHGLLNRRHHLTYSRRRAACNRTVLIVPQISGVVSSKAAPYRNRSAPGGELASLGLLTRQSALGDSMTIYEMALSRIVAGFVVAIGRLIEMVFELVI